APAAHPGTGGPPRHTRADLDARGIACTVGGLVEGDFEHLGAVGALVRPIAGVEHRAGDEPAGVADLKAIAAPVDARLDLGGCAGRGVDGAGLHAPPAHARLVRPTAVTA